MLEPWPRDRGMSEREHWEAQIVEYDGSLGELLPLDEDAPGRVVWHGEEAQSPVGASVTVHGKPPPLSGGQTVRLTYKFDDVSYSLPPLSPQGLSPLVDIGSWFDLSLIDKTSDYSADGIDFPIVIEAGTRIVGSAATVLRTSRPDQVFTLPDSDLTFRNLLDFPIGTDPLFVFNEHMEALGCSKLYPLLDGGLQASEWVAPANRPVRMVFGPENAGYMPDVRTESDFLGTPNVAHYEATGSSSADTLVGRWRDDDPASPWSIPSRKKRIYAPKGRGAAANQFIADQQAMRIGLDHPRRGRTAVIRGGFQPILRGDIIETIHPDFPELSARWEVLSLRLTQALGSMTEWLVKEIPE